MKDNIDILLFLAKKHLIQGPPSKEFLKNSDPIQAHVCVDSYFSGFRDMPLQIGLWDKGNPWSNKVFWLGNQSWWFRRGRWDRDRIQEIFKDILIFKGSRRALGLLATAYKRERNTKRGGKERCKGKQD